MADIGAAGRLTFEKSVSVCIDTFSIDMVAVFGRASCASRSRLGEQVASAVTTASATRKL